MAQEQGYDRETGLLNATAFQERVDAHALACATERGHSLLAVLSIELQRLDEMAHSGGEAMRLGIVRSAAERLNGCVRTGDIIARTGRNRFRVLVDPLHSPEIAASIAHKICQTLQLPIIRDGTRVRVSGAVGISILSPGNTDPRRLIAGADEAVKQARANGEAFSFAESAHNTSSCHRVDLQENPREALAREEFTLHYQPRIDVATQRTVSGEGLLRWQHPDHGRISPSDFIPLIESTGLIHDVGAWVLDRACCQVANWQAMGFRPVGVSVNVSGRQLDHPDFPDMVAHVLNRTGLAPEMLELEITESAIIRRTEEVADTLRRIRDTGVRIALDDFGTGYSSLVYLRKLPLDTVKVDRAFILDVANDRGNIVLLRSIVELTHALGLRVVAEGVETSEQFDVVRRQGCDEVQGFLFSRALPPEEFASQFLHNGAASSHRHAGHTGRRMPLGS